jgi:hypothetical protein
MRPIILTAIGVAISSVVVAAPASANDRGDRGGNQNDNLCGTHVCVSTVHVGHNVKSITVRVVDGLGAGTVHVRWADFHRTANVSTSRKWNIDDKQGRARDESKKLRHSDVVCASLERLGLTIEKNICVAV